MEGIIVSNESIDFIKVFEEMSNLTMSLYLRDSEMMKCEMLSDASQKLTILKKEQESDFKTYSELRKTFLDFIDSCDEFTLREYTQILTKIEGQYNADVKMLESSCANEEEIKKKKILAKSYYDNIEEIYSAIDNKIRLGNSLRLGKIKKDEK